MSTGKLASLIKAAWKDYKIILRGIKIETKE